MHSVMRSDFLNGLLSLDRLQRDSGFHLRAEASPLPPFHPLSVSQAAILHLIGWSEFWGAPHGWLSIDVSGLLDRPGLVSLKGESGSPPSSPGGCCTVCLL